ncbi:MAG: thioredoxin family protein [Planctomycetaceae bacterium]|nr:thioredoxin family protein [Planctomycetaceae bacterium]
MRLSLGSSGLLLLLLILTFAPVANVVSAADIGSSIDDFQLQDYRGKEHRLSDYQQSEVVVLAFLGTECPLVKLYGPRLAAMSDQFGPDKVTVLGINSNSHDSVTEIASYARRHGIEFPILKDAGNKLADQLGAERTPEVLVLDSNRIVRYHGRIDDQYGVGYIKDEPAREDLKIAIQEILDGKPVSIASTKPVGCRIGRMKDADPNAEVTYTNTIAHILQKRCVECHREGEIAPFALRDYDEVAGWAEMIQEVVHENRMPPWHADPEIGEFQNDRHLSDEEKSLIDQWVAAGAPEGAPADLPEPVEFVTGWQLPREPDFVMDITDKPFVVPAEGEVKYQYFSIDPGFEDDKWVKAVEIQPGNRAVVHHILMFVLPKGSEREAFPGGATGYDGAYVPGLRTIPYPEGMAKRFPANSTLVFQVHYTPVGTDQEDVSRVGLIFAEEDEVEYEVRSISAVNTELDIPPHEGNYRSEASSRLMRQDAKLIELMAHMHLRGKAFRYEAVYPNGERETLLDIPKYDFNWQTAYRLTEPMDLPKGARIHCVAYFDNSEKNLANPNPDETVRWGTQTWEEMLIGYFDIAVPKEAAEHLSAYERRAEELVARFDKDLDDKVGRREVPLKMQIVFATLDLDGNGELTVTEIAEAMEKHKDKFQGRRRDDFD